MKNYLTKFRDIFCTRADAEKIDFQKRARIIYNQIAGNILRKSGIMAGNLLWGLKYNKIRN